MKDKQLKRQEFEKAVKPAIKFLNDYCRPHCRIIIDCINAELVEGVQVIHTEEFLKD